MFVKIDIFPKNMMLTNKKINDFKILIILSVAFILHNYSFGQKSFKKITRKFNTDTMQYDVKNVIKLEQAFGIKKPKQFEELYNKFLSKIPTKKEVEKLTNGLSEKEKAKFLFKIIGNSLEQIRYCYMWEEPFLLNGVVEGLYANDCDAFTTFYASAFEKMYETKVDSTPFRFMRTSNHVFAGYKLKNDSIFIWETTTNEHVELEIYKKNLQSTILTLNSKEMWSSLFYTFSIMMYNENQQEAKKYFEKARQILGTKVDLFFENQEQNYSKIK